VQALAGEVCLANRQSYTRGVFAPFRRQCESGMKMKPILCLLFLLGTSTVLPAQSPPNSPAVSGNNTDATAAKTPASSIQAILDRLQGFTTQSAQDVAGLQIDRWRANNPTKSAAQANADSVHTNLTGTLPGLIEAARTAPDDVNAEFKLYRNVVVLYEVFGTVTEATRIYGQKSQYDSLAAEYQTLASVRRNLGEALEDLTASTQSQMRQMGVQIKNQQQQLSQAQAAATDARDQLAAAQAELAKKSAPKKRPAAKKPATTANSSTSPAAPAANPQASPAASTPKP